MSTLLIFSLFTTSGHVVLEQSVEITYEWIDMNNTTPGNLLHHNLAYDVSADKTILFSGRFVNGTLNENTWAYDLESNTWELMNPTHTTVSASTILTQCTILAQTVMSWYWQKNPM